MLFKVHEELVEVKKRIDGRGKLFENFSDDKEVKIESIKYELLKRTNQSIPENRRNTHKQGEISIKATYDQMRSQNPEEKDTADVMELYCRALNNHTFGDNTDLAMNMLNQAEAKYAELLAGSSLSQEMRPQIEDFHRQILPLINDLKKAYNKDQAAKRKRMMKIAALGGLVIGSLALAFLAFN